MGREIIVKFPRFMTCVACGGSGLVGHYHDGSPNECQRCGATGKVIARDEGGRFLKWDEVSCVRSNHIIGDF
jgi:DnaJ-class molecular chaperone